MNSKIRFMITLIRDSKRRLTGSSKKDKKAKTEETTQVAG